VPLLAQPSYKLPLDPYNQIEFYTRELFAKIKLLEDHQNTEALEHAFVHKNARVEKAPNLHHQHRQKLSVKSRSSYGSDNLRFDFADDDDATEYTIEEDALLPKRRKSISNSWLEGLGVFVLCPQPI
jgi:hypothetical protein